MSQLVYSKDNLGNETLVEIYDVGIVMKEYQSTYDIEFIRVDKIISVGKGLVELIDIDETGDRYEYKICDRCYKYLKTADKFENNRIKKDNVITKRPSCRDCRLIKNGVSISRSDRLKWNKLKPRKGVLFECPICKKKSIGGISKHVLDHNHSNGAVRGYICESCNTGIGRFDDNIDLLFNAIEWLDVKNVDVKKTGTLFD
jgi:hypothetical protein